MSRYEIEQKYRIQNPVVIRALLKHLGAKLIAKGPEFNELYERDGILRSQGAVLRLRRHGSRTALLTYKGPRLQSVYKKRFEIETPVAYGPMKEILKRLGFSPVAAYSKKREEYCLSSAHITLDFLQRHGWFIEIEGSVSAIKALEKKLRLSREQREERTYIEMVCEAAPRTRAGH